MNLQFSQSQIVDRFNFAQLPENQQLQFLIAGRNAWGFQQPFSLLEIFKQGDTGEQMTWEFYQIIDADTNTHLYDAWILAGDSGTVFYANLPASTEVEMCQSYFDAVVSDEQVSALAEAIGKAYKKSKRAFDDENGGFDSNKFTSYWDKFYKKMDATLIDEAFWDKLTKGLEATLGQGSR